MGAMFDTAPYALPHDGETAHLHVPLFAATGALAGPRLVVTAPAGLARNLAERLWDIDGLDRMRGALIVRADDQDPAFDMPDALLAVDGGMGVTQAYFRVLGHMTALGMIAGRGVPLRWVA